MPWPTRGTLDFDFATGATEWVGGFADLPVGSESFFELAWGWAPLPNELGGHGVFLSGNNHSDDLFMFLRRRVSGLKPGATYAVDYELVLATNAPTGCVGVGGAPGESVFVKAGASTEEPLAVVRDGYYRMNIDKGSQSRRGENAAVLGDLANGDTDCVNPPYKLKTLRSRGEKVRVQADTSGALWLLVGTDSGFEATSTPYYSSIRATLTPVGEATC